MTKRFAKVKKIKDFFLDNDFKVIFAGKKMYEICVCLHARMHSSKAQTLSVIFWRNINAMVDLSFLQN